VFGFREPEKLRIEVFQSSGEKCERLWMRSNTVGTIPEHPTLCSHCAEVVKQLLEEVK